MRSTVTFSALVLVLALALAPVSALLPAKPCQGTSSALDPTDCSVWQQFYDMNSPGGSGDTGWKQLCDSFSGIKGDSSDFYRTDPCQCRMKDATPGADWGTGIFCESDAVSGQLHLTRMYLIYMSPKLEATQNNSDPYWQKPKYAFPPDIAKMKKLNSFFLGGNNLRGLLPDIDYSQYKPGQCVEHAGTQYCCELGGGGNQYACPLPEAAVDNCYSSSVPRIKNDGMWCGYCAPGAGADPNTTNPQSCGTCIAGKFSNGYQPAVVLPPKTGNASIPEPTKGAPPCQSCKCSPGYGCPAGSRTETDDCAECAAGKHSSQGGKPSDPTRDYCEDCKCPPGQASEGRGLATCNCAGCPAGKFGAGGGKTCTVCPAGKHQAKDNQPTCLDCECAPGKASSATNVSAAQCTCTACPAGSYGAGKAAQCLNCSAGKFSPVPTTMCVNCPAGQYSDSTLNTNCQPTQCPVGRHAPAGSTDPTAECVNCPAGSYGAGGAEQCLNCPAGKFSPQPTTMCDKCPEGQYSDSTLNPNCQPNSSSKGNNHTGAIVGGALGAVAAFAGLLLFVRRQKRTRPFGKWFYRRNHGSRNEQSSVSHPLISDAGGAA